MIVLTLALVLAGVSLGNCIRIVWGRLEAAGRPALLGVIALAVGLGILLTATVMGGAR